MSTQKVKNWIKLILYNMTFSFFNCYFRALKEYESIWVVRAGVSWRDWGCRSSLVFPALSTSYYYLYLSHKLGCVFCFFLGLLRLILVFNTHRSEADFLFAVLWNVRLPPHHHYSLPNICILSLLTTPDLIWPVHSWRILFSYNNHEWH